MKKACAQLIGTIGTSGPKYIYIYIYTLWAISPRPTLQLIQGHSCNYTETLMMIGGRYSYWYQLRIGLSGFFIGDQMFRPQVLRTVQFNHRGGNANSE